jgi:hypothetical protein
MRKITMLLTALVILAIAQPTSANTILDRDERQIEFNELPSTAQNFIKKHFASEQPSYVIKEVGLVSNEYEVVFESGLKLEFGNNGDWKEIKCHEGEVPTALVPNKIADYVTKRYPTAVIKQLKRERYEWEVKLSGGLELTFDKNFKLVDIDD